MPENCRDNSSCNLILGYLICSFLLDSIYLISIFLYLNSVYKKKIFVYTNLFPIINSIWFMILFSIKYQIVTKYSIFRTIYIIQSLAITYYIIAHLFLLFNEKIYSLINKKKQEDNIKLYITNHQTEYVNL